MCSNRGPLLALAPQISISSECVGKGASRLFVCYTAIPKSPLLMMPAALLQCSVDEVRKLGGCTILVLYVMLLQKLLQLRLERFWVLCLHFHFMHSAPSELCCVKLQLEPLPIVITPDVLKAAQAH